MFAALLPLLSPVLGKLLDLIPDPQARAKAEAEAYAMLSSQQHEIARTILETNKTEAGHRSIFVAGWRPFIGWVCGGAFAWHYLGQPAMVFGLSAAGLEVPVLPAFDIGELMTILMGMLGMGALRTYEKKSGVAR